MIFFYAEVLKEHKKSIKCLHLHAPGSLHPAAWMQEYMRFDIQYKKTNFNSKEQLWSSCSKRRLW